MKPQLDPSDNVFSESFDIKKLFSDPAEPPPPSFNELWSKAESSITELMETFPEQFWERAKVSEQVPLLMPRRQEEYREFRANLKAKEITPSGRGKTRDPDTPINREVDAAYKRIRDLKLKTRVAQIALKNQKEGVGEIKFAPLYEKYTPLFKEIMALPPLNESTLNDSWKHWLTEAFLSSHNGEPEESKELLDMVKLRVNNNRDKPTAADYRKEIKKDFRKAIPRLAKELSKIYGT